MMTENDLIPSEKMQDVLKIVHKVASTDIPILIKGEPGTGRKFIARTIHEISGRSDGPLIIVNCGSLSRTLLGRDIFGYVKGSFQEADDDCPGCLESANNGTLVIEDVNKLPAPLQRKMQQYIKDKTTRRLGGVQYIRVNTRLIATVRHGVYDRSTQNRIYVRMGFTVVSLPPLRERNNDVLILADYFLKKYATENNKDLKSFSSDSVHALTAHSWPGNIHELENRVISAVMIADGTEITPADLGFESESRSYEGLNLKKAQNQLAKDMISRSLSLNNNNLTEAAAALGISRPALYQMMQRIGINPRK